MNQLIKVGKDTSYIQGFTNVGVVSLGNGQVCLIDTGIGDDDAHVICENLDNNHLIPAFIINTHCHADHVGGNGWLQNIYHCPAYSVATEIFLSEYTDVACSFLYGGYPPEKMQETLLRAKVSEVYDINKFDLPSGFRFERIDGHSFAMIAVKTPDDIWFIADSVIDPSILRLHHMSYNYNISKYLESLDILGGLRGDLFLPSHARLTDNIDYLIRFNRDNIRHVTEDIMEVCKKPKNHDEIFKALYDKWQIQLSYRSYSVMGSALRSLLTYMLDSDMLEMKVKDNYLLWHSKENK